MTPKWKILVACAVAMFADLMQIVFFPLFIEGAISPFDDAVDFAVGGILTLLLGWNWAFLPTAIAKLVPVLDIAPSWTMAVFYVVWKKGKLPDPAAPTANALPAGGPNEVRAPEAQEASH